jgi:NADH:ubiquinone oxidoreductase subunit 3 (subunit A)
MDVTAAAVIIFAMFSLFVPASMLLTSIALRKNTTKNTVRDASYESGEDSRGERISIMNEYLHYFGMFIAFEIIVGIVLIWVPVARKLPLNSGIEILGLLVLGFVLEAFVMLIARKKE